MSGTAEPAAPAPARKSRGRSVAVFVLIVLAGLLLLISAFAIWVNRVALNTQVFTDTSTELIEDDAIRQAVSTRVVDELFESVDVQAELQGSEEYEKHLLKVFSKRAMEAAAAKK